MQTRRTLWSTALGGAVALAVAGLGGLLLTRHGPLTAAWGYGSFVLAAVGAVSSSLLCIMRAHGVDE